MNKDPIVGVIYPPNSRLKVECRIYPSQREMLRASRRHPSRSFSIGNNTMAFCQTDSNPPEYLAIVVFSRTHLSPGTIAHEFVHAALALMARRKISSIPCTTKEAVPVEEDLCHIVDTLVDRFHKKFL